ncbi:MAG: hypothetical protein PVI78_10155 [Anaerolineales bacterium]|jgi:hypothetical protein
MQTSQYPASWDRFIRTSGFLFLLFGLMSVLFRLTQFLILGDPPLEELVLTRTFMVLQGIPSLLAAIFFLSGSTALYLRQAHRLGVLGLIVYFVAFAALVISTGAMWTYAFTAPVLAREAPQLLTTVSSGIVQAVLLSMMLGQIGWFLLVVVSFKANIIPRWALFVAVFSMILVIVMTAFAQTPILRLIYNLLLGMGPLAIGYVLWRHGEDLANQQSG